MYPNLYYAFKEIFGIEIPAFRIINSFGFFVALAFLIASVFLVKELRRKQAAGIFTFKETIVTVGRSATFAELLINFFLGFVLGFKIVGVFLIPGALNDPQSFIFSSGGHTGAGILLGLFFAGLKWWEKNKKKLPQPEKRKIRIWPSDRVGDIVIIAAAFGFLGAKVFDNLENWDRFIQDPIGNLLSASGLTFYGGLIVATIALGIYFKRSGIRFIDVADAAAPSLMLAYGLGRIGCQVAGDGDWGIVNSAYVTNAAGDAIPANPEQFNQILNNFSQFYSEQFGSVEAVHHTPVKAFMGLPDWLFAYSYPHNVNEVGINIPNCTWDNFCYYLPLPVYPTPFYEILMSLLLFGLLWSVRKKLKQPGRLFGLYLIVNGLERFLIEKIRVNTTYSIFGFHPTQAEIISVFLVLSGILLMWYAKYIKPSVFKKTNITT